MSGVSEYATAVVAVLERDLRLMLSYRMRPLTVFLAPVTTIVVFYYVSRLVRVDAVGSSDGYFAYVVVGIVGLNMLTSTVGATPIALRQELVAGTFEHIVLSPFGPVRGIVAMLAFPFIQSVVVATVTVGFAALVFDLPISSSVALAIPAAVLGGFAFAPFAVFALAALLIVKQTTSVVSLLITALAIFAGVYFPVELLPAAIRWLSEVQPFTPALELLRDLVTTVPTKGSPWANVIRLVGFTAVLLPVSLWALTRALARSRRRGTIIEY